MDALTHKARSKSIDDLVAELPEVYQPIFGHPELSYRVSRRCDDRLAQIISVYKSLESVLNRPLRVIDLGCGQGFFSHSLSQLGASVHGIDVLGSNIAVCTAIAAERGDQEIRFETARIEDILPKLHIDEYDLILGLSVFHHIVESRGVPYVREMLAAAGYKAAAALFEMALHREPMDWAPAQPKFERELIGAYSFVHELARYETHLSDVRRPLFFASNRFWHFGGQAGIFDKWTAASNRVVPDPHEGTRRSYFGQQKIVTQYRLDHEATQAKNLLEWENTVNFLENPPPGLSVPRLDSCAKTDTEAWVIRGLLPGISLETHIAEGHKSYDPHRVLRAILRQLQMMEEIGLFHNDLRTWNVIISPAGDATLIDYGSITKSQMDCTWPDNVFLSFLIFMREVLVGVQEFPEPIRASCFNPDRLPEPYRQAVWKMLQASLSEWKFGDFLRNLEAERTEASFPSFIDRRNASLLLETFETGILDLRSKITNLQLQTGNLRSQAARYEKFIATLRMPDAPRALRMVLPLARMIRKIRTSAGSWSR